MVREKMEHNNSDEDNNTNIIAICHEASVGELHPDVNSEMWKGIIKLKA
jgi:hypothetical protein